MGILDTYSNSNFGKTGGFGGGGSSGITAHIHSTSSGEGGSLRMRNSTTTGTAMDINSTVYPIEVLL